MSDRPDILREYRVRIIPAERAGPQPKDPAFPFVLSAGERRGETSNTAIRDPGWHRKGAFGPLRICPWKRARKFRTRD